MLRNLEDFVDPEVGGKVVRSWGGYNFNSDSTELRDAFNAELVKFKETDAWKEILTGHGFTPADLEGSFARTTEDLCASL